MKNPASLFFEIKALLVFFISLLIISGFLSFWIETEFNFLLQCFSFGHFVIALFFIGAHQRPLYNNWVIKYGMFACIAILPLAFLTGFFRKTPLAWQLVDSVFAIFGFLFLFVINKKITTLKKQLEYKEVEYV